MEKKFMFIRREQNLDDRREIDEFRVITLDKTIVNDYQCFSRNVSMFQIWFVKKIFELFSRIYQKNYIFLFIHSLSWFNTTDNFREFLSPFHRIRNIILLIVRLIFT